MSSKTQIAQMLAGSPASFDGQGLETPPEMAILQNLAKVAGGYGMGSAGAQIAQALAGQAIPAMQSLGESGALFPEGAPMPTDKASIKELGDILPESQQAYLRNQALSNWHAQMQDFPRVLADKWALLKHAGGN